MSVVALNEGNEGAATMSPEKTKLKRISLLYEMFSPSRKLPCCVVMLLHLNFFFYVPSLCHSQHSLVYKFPIKIRLNQKLPNDCPCRRLRYIINQVSCSNIRVHKRTIRYLLNNINVLMVYSIQCPHMASCHCRRWAAE